MPEWKHFIPYLQGGADLQRSLKFYEETLGFSRRYEDDEIVILQRDDVELFLQNYEDYHVAFNTQVRVRVKDIAMLYQQYKNSGILGYRDDVTKPGITDLEDTPWGTREFTIRDWAGNALQFTESLEKTDE